MTEARQRGLILPTVTTLVAVAILVSLGNWQLRRLAWKEALIAAVTERPREAVRDLPAPGVWDTVDPLGDDGYRPYRLAGHFEPAKEARVFTSLPDPRGRYSGPGYWVMTPFVLDSGGTVWVNRGFVPVDLATPERRGEALTDAATRVIGLMRPSETRGLFTPRDQPESDQFYAREVDALSAAKRVSGPVAPFTIDLIASETPPGGLPQAGETRISFPNDHLQYALTWYGLAAALLAVFGTFVWRSWKTRG